MYWSLKSAGHREEEDLGRSWKEVRRGAVDGGERDRKSSESRKSLERKRSMGKGQVGGSGSCRWGDPREEGPWAHYTPCFN